MSAATCTSRAHSRTSWPTRPRCTASAVPQLPAPRIAIVRTSGFPRHQPQADPLLGPGQHAAPGSSGAGTTMSIDAASAAATHRRRAAGGVRDRRQRHRREHRADRDVPRDPDSAQKDGERRADRQRRQHGEDAARGRDALAAAEAKPDRKDMADDGGETGRRRAPLPGRTAATSMTLAAPLAMSSSTTVTPARTPDARSTFAAPRFPLPMRRRSAVPSRRARISANGIEPMRYASRRVQRRSRRHQAC